MRRALVSIAVALAATTGVTASGWALQAAALPAPKPAARIAADASAWFHEHRLVVDIFHMDHRRTEGACLRGWFRGPHGPRARASLLSLGHGPNLWIPARRHVWRMTLRGETRQPKQILALVGCSDELAPALAAVAQNGGHLTAERSYAANQPAIALEFVHARGERLTLYVSPRYYQPLVAFVALKGRTATARLYLARASPHLLSHFDLPPISRRSRP